MEKKLIDESCANNVANIQISEETKALLLCRARLSDIYQTVSNVVYLKYGTDVDKEFSGFWDAFSKFDSELMKALSCFIGVTSLESNYTKYEATPEAARGQPNNNDMNEDRVLTMAKSALKQANIIRYENGHEIIDVSLLRTIPDGELMKYRNVGKTTIEKIQEIRKSLDWL